MTALAPTLQAFFTDRLLGQRGASALTIASYRDAWRLLLCFATKRTGKQPCDLDIGDLDARLVAAFLTHLETDRGNAVSTRNQRLAAVHSLFAYAALRHPEHAASIRQVLAIPPKRIQRNLVTFLDDGGKGLVGRLGCRATAGQRGGRDGPAGHHGADARRGRVARGPLCPRW